MAAQTPEWCVVGPGGHDVAHEFREVAAFMNDHFTNFSTATVAFDCQEELLWVGTESVRILKRPKVKVPCLAH